VNFENGIKRQRRERTAIAIFDAYAPAHIVNALRKARD